MFDRFTANVRRAMALARHEAVERLQPAIGAEHMLLAILSIPDGSAVRALRRQGADPEDVTRTLRSALPVGSVDADDTRRQVPFAPIAKRILERTRDEATKLGSRSITTAHLLLAIARETEGIVGHVNEALDLQVLVLRESVRNLREPAPDPIERRRATSARPLPAYGRDLVSAARHGELDPVIGREREITRCANVLARAGDTAVLLVGAPGVGKSAVVEALAHRAVDGTFPGIESIWRLDVPLLIAGTTDRDTLEDRIDQILNLSRHRDATVLVLDDIHHVVRAGSVGPGGWWNRFRLRLKPAIERGEIGMIGVADRTAREDLRSRDLAFWARFQTVVVEAPDREELSEILGAHATRLRTYHDVSLQDGVLPAVVELATRHLGALGPPRAAVDLLDHAMACARLRSEPSVDVGAIVAAVSEMTGVGEETIRRPDGPPP